MRRRNAEWATALRQEDVATHACRRRDGVGAADERLAIVEADEDVHRPAGEEEIQNNNMISVLQYQQLLLLLLLTIKIIMLW